MVLDGATVLSTRRTGRNRLTGMRVGRGRVRGVVLAGSTAVACGGAPQAEPVPARAAGELPVMDSAAPGTPWSACLERIGPSDEPAAAVAKLGRVCGRPAAQRALSPVREAEQTEEEAVERYTFRAEHPGACFRVYAVGDAGVNEMAVEVVNPGGDVIAASKALGRVAAAPHDAPLCIEEPAVYTVEVAVTRGRGRYALQVWTHRPAAEKPGRETVVGARGLPVREHR